MTLYTGNDDHIVLDLVTPFVVKRDGREVTVRIRGGLLGHWSVWTRERGAAVRAHPQPPWTPGAWTRRCSPWTHP